MAGEIKSKSPIVGMTVATVLTIVGIGFFLFHKDDERSNVHPAPKALPQSQSSSGNFNIDDFKDSLSNPRGFDAPPCYEWVKQDIGDGTMRWVGTGKSCIIEIRPRQLSVMGSTEEAQFIASSMILMAIANRLVFPEDFDKVNKDIFLRMWSSAVDNPGTRVGDEFGRCKLSMEWLPKLDMMTYVLDLT